MSNTETLFKKILTLFKGRLFEGCFLTICLISLTWQKYPQMISICSKILSLYWKAKPAYTQEFYTDQSLAIGGLSIYAEEVIKNANSFYKNNFNKKNRSNGIKPLGVLLSASVYDLYYLAKVNLGWKSRW